MVLDSHTHAWGPDVPERPWVNEALVERVAELPVESVYTAETLLDDMDAAGVDEAVLVGFPICEWTDNSYTVEAVSAHDRLTGVVLVDPFDPEGPERLRQLMAEDSIIGVRLGALFPPEQMWEEVADPESTWLRESIERTEFWEAAADTDAAIHLLINSDQLDQLVDLVEAHPELTYVVDHLARADVSTPPGEGGFATLAELADRRRVLVKVSALPFLSNEEFPYEDVHDHIRWVLNRFERERVAWGSDYPYVSDLVDSYADTLGWLEHVDGLSRSDWRWLTERSLRRHVPRL